jgi:hypothetical protein
MYASSYIERIAASDPTWATCVDLYNITQHAQLGRVTGALASAIRTGSEVTHEDWGEDWIDLSLQWLPDMELLQSLIQNHQYGELDKWLQANERRIVGALHLSYVEQIPKTA